MAREGDLVSAVLLTLLVERGAEGGELRIIVEGFDPIAVKTANKIVLRPEWQ